MTQTLLTLQVQNFKALADVTLPLSPLTVLVGPNGSGKSTVLETFGFLAAAAESINDAILRDYRGSTISPAELFEELLYRGAKSKRIKITVRAILTRNASRRAPDEYTLELSLGRGREPVLRRKETFTYKRTAGRGRRITLSQGDLRIEDEKPEEPGRFRLEDEKKGLLSPEAIGISALPLVRQGGVSQEVARFRDLLSSFEVFDPRPHEMALLGNRNDPGSILPNAQNLPAALGAMAEGNAWDAFLSDLRQVAPYLRDIQIVRPSGTDRILPLFELKAGFSVALDELSFGTRRLLALLARIHGPGSRRIVLIEEIDHGLHPHALDLLIERLRDGTSKSQFILTTHSPTLVSRLEPHELVICELDSETGAARIPAVSPELISKQFDAADDILTLGELWFAGVLGGGLEA